MKINYAFAYSTTKRHSLQKKRTMNVISGGLESRVEYIDTRELYATQILTELVLTK